MQGFGPVFLAAACFGGGLPPGVVAEETTPLYEEVTVDSGLDFIYENGASEKLYLPEITGGGVALFDFDGDGDLDVYLVQGGAIGEEGGPSDRLFRNDLEAPGGQIRFVDITTMVSLSEAGYGMGVTSGDYDNDGWVDLYVTNLGDNTLLHNDDGARLHEVTGASGTGDDGWSTGASFVDFDRDGWLDLYVVNYVEWSTDRVATCYATSTRRDYCGPSAYPPARDRLFRNRGDGTFEPFAEGLLAARPGPGLAVASLDANADGYPDFFVANDGAPNFLWTNREGRTFVEEGLVSGLAVNRFGVSEASMGIALGDADGDGDEDLFLTHLSGETHTFYSQTEAGLFDDKTLETGLGTPSHALTAFGAQFVDADGDGDLDLVVASGAVRLEQGSEGGLGQPNQLFINRRVDEAEEAKRRDRFEEASDLMPPSFSLHETSRGLAVGDLDNDLAMDVLVVNNAGPSRLYRSLAAADPERRSLGLRLLLAAGRDALGARARLESQKGISTRTVRVDGSYASAGDPRVILPLPVPSSSTSGLRLSVSWPDGELEVWEGEALDRLLAGSGYQVLRQRDRRP